MADKERTLYCGNLSEKVTEDILYELFLQAGPLENVSLPKDKDGKPRRFAFITFKHAVSVPYTMALMNGISLYGKPLNLDARTGAEPEHNPYLEKLMQYRTSLVHQGPVGNRNYNCNPRDLYDEGSRRYDPRFDSRAELPRSDYNSWTPYPGQASPYGMGVSGAYGNQVPSQSRFNQNSMPQVSYPNRGYGGQMPWSRNHR